MISSLKEANPCRLISKVLFWFAIGMMILKLFFSPLLCLGRMNGMLEPWFQNKCVEDVGQVLAYFAISKLGEPPIDGKTDTNPEGLTAAYGKWADAVAARLHAGGLSCKVLDKEPFQKQMLEKLIWISAFMLVGASHSGAILGVVEKEFRSEVSSLIAELASAAAAAEKGRAFEEAMEDR